MVFLKSGRVILTLVTFWYVHGDETILVVTCPIPWAELRVKSHWSTVWCRPLGLLYWSFIIVQFLEWHRAKIHLWGQCYKNYNSNAWRSTISYIPLLRCYYVQYKPYRVATGNHSAIWMSTGNHSAIWIAASNHSAIWIAGSTAIDLVTVYGWLWRLQWMICGS